MDDYLAKLRQARESWRKVDGFEFLIRRPTEAQEAALAYDLSQGSRSGGAAVEALTKRVQMMVVGWRGVREADIIGKAGGALEVPFNSDLLIEWVSDKWSFLSALNEACRSVVDDHAKKKAKTEKN